MKVDILPKLVTFDGYARSGKGTIVSLVKDYLRDEAGLKVMYIDAGQVFRVLVVLLQKSAVNLDNTTAIDEFLANGKNLKDAIGFVKEVYKMPKIDRDSLIYTDEVSENSAKVGARPLSQAFKDTLLRKWLEDAKNENYDVVLLDGRALGEVGAELQNEGFCNYVLGLFFVCDPVVSAQRVLGYMPKPYTKLSEGVKKRVDIAVQQIKARDRADAERSVQPVVMPKGALKYMANEIPCELPPSHHRPMVIIDRSIELPFDIMALPTAQLIAHYLS